MMPSESTDGYNAGGGCEPGDPCDKSLLERMFNTFLEAMTNTGRVMSSEEEVTDEDYNQEQEEELLDIPTFLRRQAN